MTAPTLRVATRIREAIDTFRAQRRMRPDAVMLHNDHFGDLAHDASLDAQIRYDKPTAQWYVDGIPIRFHGGDANVEPRAVLSPVAAP